MIMEQYIQLFKQIFNTIFHTYPQLVAERKKQPLLIDFKNGLNLLAANNPNWQLNIVFYLFGAIILTFLRRSIKTFLIEKILVQNGFVLKKDKEKFSESFWTLLICSFFSILSGYIVWEYGLIANGENLFKGYRFDSPIPLLVKILYFCEISYYLHACYAVFYMNSWKKDSPLMIVHHIVALMLILFSYWTRTYLFGILTMYLHDSCDVALEGSKMLIKLQFEAIRRNEQLFRHCFLSLFIFAWFLNRLYYFPLIAITKSLEFYQTIIMQDWSIFILMLVILLFIIYLMDIYWVMLIIKLVITSLFAGQKIDDIREIDEKEQSDIGLVQSKEKLHTGNGHNEKPKQN